MFIDHPEGRIVINETVFPRGFFALVEPTYALEDPALYDGNGHYLSGTYVAREFIPGERHHLSRHSTGTQDQRDIDDAELTAYVAKHDDYVAAFEVWENGGLVGNDAGTIIYTYPPTLTADKIAIPAVEVPASPIAAETAQITADVGDAGYAGDILWVARDATGSIVGNVTEAMTAGVSALDFLSNLAGTYLITAGSADFGDSIIYIEVY